MNIERVLSGRELQVVRELAKGKSNIEIANGLRLSDKTVKNHLSHIYRKTGISGRLPLTVLVLRSEIRRLQRRGGKRC